MTIVKTNIGIEHLELIKIFFKANELIGSINPVEIIIRGVHHNVLELEFKDEDSEIKVTYMGVVHAGILNMFDDYLMKCGVDVDAIKPKTMHRQLQTEREERLNKEFAEKYKNIAVAQKVT